MHPSQSLEDLNGYNPFLRAGTVTYRDDPGLT
jgi:hypothetical protein